jgi:hypothetical protein
LDMYRVLVKANNENCWREVYFSRKSKEVVLRLFNVLYQFQSSCCTYILYGGMYDRLTLKYYDSYEIGKVTVTQTNVYLIISSQHVFAQIGQVMN